jgi:GDP-mannose 6-dehydrogenase
VYDKNVSLANLQGANRAYIENEIPHIASLMADSIDEVLENSEVIIIGNKAAAFKDVFHRLRDEQVMIDLVRVTEKPVTSNGHYQGISW